MSLTAPIVHIRWMVLLGAGLALLALGPLAADWEAGQERQRADTIAAERAGLQQDAARFEEDMQLARDRNTQMGAKEIDALLAPVDRMRGAERLEHAASDAHLAHFTYRLGPEKSAKSATAIDALAQTELTMQADMPLDTDAYRFLQNLGSTLPGRLRLKHLTLTRASSSGTPLNLTNIHMEATLEWFSNQSDKGQAP